MHLKHVAIVVLIFAPTLLGCQAKVSDNKNAKVASMDSRDRSMSFFAPSPTGPWGDYGSLLAHGMSCANDKYELDPLSIDRTGPFAPPVTNPSPGTLIVTDSCRRSCEKAFPSMQYKSVAKHKIVRSNWHEWDWNAVMVPELPPSNEPEGYIVDFEHSARAASEMEELWALELREGAKCRTKSLPGDRPWEYSILLDTSTWNGDDLFITYLNDTPIVIVSERGKEWLETVAPRWFEYRHRVEAY